MVVVVAAGSIQSVAHMWNSSSTTIGLQMAAHHSFLVTEVGSMPRMIGPAAWQIVQDVSWLSCAHGRHVGHNQPALGKQTFTVNIKIQQNCSFFIPFLRSTALTGSIRFMLHNCLFEKNIWKSHSIHLQILFLLHLFSVGEGHNLPRWLRSSLVSGSCCRRAAAPALEGFGHHRGFQTPTNLEPETCPYIGTTPPPRMPVTFFSRFRS